MNCRRAQRKRRNRRKGIADGEEANDQHAGNVGRGQRDADHRDPRAAGQEGWALMATVTRDQIDAQLKDCDRLSAFLVQRSRATGRMRDASDYAAAAAIIGCYRDAVEAQGVALASAPPAHKTPHPLDWCDGSGAQCDGCPSCRPAPPAAPPEDAHGPAGSFGYCPGCYSPLDSCTHCGPASAAPPDPPGLLSRGQARAIHIMTNVAHARNGRVLFACDGPDCQVCADLTLLALPRALSPLAARQSDPPGLARIAVKVIETFREEERASRYWREDGSEESESAYYAAMDARLAAFRELLAYPLPASPRAETTKGDE